MFENEIKRFLVDTLETIHQHHRPMVVLKDSKNQQRIPIAIFWNKINSKNYR